jgi:predicted O-linked N-acetylglucosamine transferase (SPINDLY family)
MSDAEVATLSRQKRVDIAIDLGGHTTGSRTGVFALRAAPIQVSYLGFPGTMGALYVDYLLTDRVVCPSGSEVFYTEKLARLPNCFMPHDSMQEISVQAFTRQEFGLPENGFVFCCFNNHYKINPPVFDVWMRLLQKLPGSVLWLSDGHQLIKDNLIKEASARGVDPSRLVFAMRLNSMADHLARYRLADLFIDTLPYNAHTTACDSLWAGLPVLTCAGESFASRVAASLLTTIGLPELVTDSHEAYEALALELATHPDKLAAIRQKLADNRLTTPLFDTQRLARDMEKLFSTMYERYQNGLAPETINS